jgi:hypothetical protein
MGGIDPVGEITARCHIIYRFGPRQRMPVKGDPSGLKLVPVSHPWRSLGGFLDYEHWLDRDRFVELDRAISLLDEDAEHTLIADVEFPEAIELIRPVQPIDYQ